MADGGVYDQLAGGFHRYSVDERWVVPHFEKMCYDNSELLKNYVHAYQATGEEFFADVARDIIRWMDEWLSDRERGGFYASQDADISMEDDGDYFTWTLDEARAVLTEEEAQVAALHYDINEVGEMHHNPAKNVLYVRAPIEEIARRMNAGSRNVSRNCWHRRRRRCTRRGCSGRRRMSTRRSMWDGTACAFRRIWKRRRYCIWRRRGDLRCGRWIGCWRRRGRRRNEQAAGEGPRHTCWLLLHVVSYSDPKAAHREVPGLLDDYAFTALACLDAYEATADLSYFKFAHAIADAMIARFYDATSGGFFDSEPAADGKSLGVLATRRKPLQDSPTPAGNPMAAIALTRLHHYTGDARLPGQSGADAGNFCGRRGTVWNFCGDLWDCGRASSGEPGAGGGDCRRRR